MAHYDVHLPLKLLCDTSAYSVGAVIAHVMSDNTERPIAYASRTPLSSEHNYVQIEKEALGIVLRGQNFLNFFMVVNLPW